MLNMSDLFAVIVMVLLVQVYLLWEVLKWLRLMGEKLGCNPQRTKRIAQLMKKLDYDESFKLFPRELSDEERKKFNDDLTELFDAETCYGPATGGQMIALLKRFDAAKK